MRQFKAINYTAKEVRSLDDLLDMMRYDGFRFCSTNLDDWRGKLKALAKADSGVVSVEIPESGFDIHLTRDQDKQWTPTRNRWRSFSMRIIRITDWEVAREL